MSSTAAQPLVAPAHWPQALKDELARNPENGAVGTHLLSETADVRVWQIVLRPGERVGFHKHVLNYFWVSVTGGRARSNYLSGETREHDYAPGEVRHYSFGKGEFMIHDLQNIGDAELIFTTVELKAGDNPPLPLGGSRQDGKPGEG